MLVLIMTAATGAWAQTNYLYLEVDPSDNTSATLMYGDQGSNPYFIGTKWENVGTFKTTVETIIVDATCGNFTGTQLRNLFNGCSKLKTVIGLRNINTENVTEMNNMFYNCTSLQTLDLSGLNTASVTTMETMFQYCSALTSIDFSGLDMANVTRMYSMFRDCTGLKSAKLSGLTSDKLTNTSGMFYGCTGLQTLDLSGLNTTEVTTMMNMFRNCGALTAIYVGDGWSVDKVTSSSNMFDGCTSLPNWDESVDKTHANKGDDGYLNKIKVTAHEGATDEYWATFYNEDRNFIAPTDTKVFKVELKSGGQLTMHEIEDKIVNAYLPVVLKATGENIVMTVTESATSNTEPTSMSGWAGPEGLEADGNMYVLNYTTTNGAGFYKLADGNTISAGKAFLYCSDVLLAREFFGFDEATGIESVSLNDGENGEVYDLQGRRVAQPGKGLYIVSGKKYIKK